MTALPITITDGLRDMAVATIVAWDRDGLVSEYDFAARYSKQHVVAPGKNHTLCGSRVRWHMLSPGDTTKCRRCFSAAARRGYLDEYGETIE